MIGGRGAVGIVVAVLLIVSAGALSASAGTNRSSHSSSAELVGSWLVNVYCGPALPPLKSLQTFTRGHGSVENANGGNAARGPSHGTWKRIGNRTYGSTSVFFRYDPTSGAFIGTLKLRSEREVAPDGQSFSGVAVGELRDAAGNLLPGSNTRKDVFTGERINVEPVPEIP